MPDISRARELLGWQPELSLDDGLCRTIAFFREVLEETGMTRPIEAESISG